MHRVSSDTGLTSQAYTGFSVAGADFQGQRLSLDSLVIQNPAATFFLRAEEEIDLEGHIHAGDILVVDRAADIVNNSLVVAVSNGEMVLRQVVRRSGRFFLSSGHFCLEILEEESSQIWGKVIYVLHPVGT